jgi:hypothetical protein
MEVSKHAGPLGDNAPRPPIGTPRFTSPESLLHAPCTPTSTTLPEALVAGPRSRCARDDDAAGSCLSRAACQRLPRRILAADVEWPNVARTRCPPSWASSTAPAARERAAFRTAQPSRPLAGRHKHTGHPSFVVCLCPSQLRPASQPSSAESFSATRLPRRRGIRG